MPRRFTKRRAVAALAAALALGVGLTACSNDTGLTVDLPQQVEGAFPAETQEQLEAAVSAAMTATGSSGALVGVWAPWSGSWVAGVGTETPEGAAVSVDESFKIGRLTRAMTCDVLYRLADNGTVRLDDAVSDYVGGVADLSNVTLEQLCDSTSGIGAYSSSRLLRMWLDNPERSWNPLELAAFGLGAERSQEPGVAYRDSDAGYLLLGLALERATGRTAAELIQEYVAVPLGLEATYLETGVPDGSGMLTGQRSARVDGDFSCTELEDVTSMSGTIGFTDSGAVSTVGDLGRYMQALATGALLPSGTDRWDDPKPASSSAPSWFTYTGGVFQAGTLVGSFDSFPGYISGAFADGESGLTVVVVLNNSAASGGNGAWLAWELAAIASKAAATGGGASPDAGLPWTAEQYQERIASSAICSAP